MRNYTPEEMKILEPLEPHLRTAYKMGFKRPSPVKDNETVADIYEAAGGKKLPRNWSCGACLYKIWYEAARIYYQTKEAMEKEAQEPKKASASERKKNFRKNKKDGKESKEHIVSPNE